MTSSIQGTQTMAREVFWEGTSLQIAYQESIWEDEYQMHRAKQLR